MKKLIFFLAAGLMCISARAQFQGKQRYNVNEDNRTVKEYGRMVVDTLAKRYFHGRGYLKEGDVKSAYFVASELYKFGLQRFKSAPTFYQNFNLSVNTFPDDAFLAFDEHFLTCGADFVPGAGCPSIKGTYGLAWLDSITLSTEQNFKDFSNRSFRDVFVVMDDKGITGEESKKVFQNMMKNPFGAKGLIVLKDKVLWTVATDTSAFPIMEVVRGKVSRSDQQVRLQVKSKFEPNFINRNVIAYVEGKEVPDSFIVVSAHYDHLGQIGRLVYFPGANDNASGIAMMLSLARHFSKKENQPKYSIAFIGFAAEEAGLIGSKKYVFAPIVPLEKTKFLLNLDIMGTGDEGITVVNATEFGREFSILDSINKKEQLLPQIRQRGPAANSDHYYFYEKGVRCFFVYTMGGIKAYHDIYDRGETLPLTEFEDVHRLFVQFIGKL